MKRKIKKNAHTNPNTIWQKQQTKHMISRSEGSVAQLNLLITFDNFDISLRIFGSFQKFYFLRFSFNFVFFSFFFFFLFPTCCVTYSLPLKATRQKKTVLKETWKLVNSSATFSHKRVCLFYHFFLQRWKREVLCKIRLIFLCYSSSSTTKTEIQHLAVDVFAPHGIFFFLTSAMPLKYI